MSKHFNGLTPGEHERLSVLLEEMGEAQQAIGKIMRHGYESMNPNDPDSLSNRGQLRTELGDVLYAIEELERHDDINSDDLRVRVDEKRQKIARYLHHEEIL